MNFYEWINIGIGIIGVIVGMVGLKSLNASTKIKNKLENVHNSTIQQAQTITINNNDGMDSYAIIKLSRETTQEELKDIVKNINSKLEKDSKDISEIKKRVDSQPTITVSNQSPSGGRNGDIWFKYD